MVTILEAMNQARTNLGIENIYIPAKQDVLTEKLLKGEITELEYRQKVLMMIKNEKERITVHV